MGCLDYCFKGIFRALGYDDDNAAPASSPVPVGQGQQAAGGATQVQGTAAAGGGSPPPVFRAASTPPHNASAAAALSEGLHGESTDTVPHSPARRNTDPAQGEAESFGAAALSGPAAAASAGDIADGKNAVPDEPLRVKQAALSIDDCERRLEQLGPTQGLDFELDDDGRIGNRSASHAGGDSLAGSTPESGATCCSLNSFLYHQRRAQGGASANLGTIPRTDSNGSAFSFPDSDAAGAADADVDSLASNSRFKDSLASTDEGACHSLAGHDGVVAQGEWAGGGVLCTPPSSTPLRDGMQKVATPKEPLPHSLIDDDDAHKDDGQINADALLLPASLIGKVRMV